MMDKQFSVDRSALAEHLKGFRERQNRSVAQTETRFLRAVGRRSGMNEPRHGVAELESGGDGDLRLSISELEVIADAYGVHRLLLDPLLAEHSVELCLVEPFESFQEVSRTEGATYYGSPGAHYRYPRRRLRELTDVSFVHLVLERGAFSDTHAHSGDELMFVLVGDIEVRLERNGQRALLSAGEFIHFYADQLHSARCIGEREAHVFVIRFYQVSPPGSRFQLYEQIASRRWSNSLRSRVFAELSATLLPPDLHRGFPAEGDDRDVEDRYGLARLLRLSCSERFRGTGRRLTLDELVSLGAQTLGFNRAKFDRLHKGETPVLVSQLNALAAAYGLEPIVLYPHAFPAVRTAIAVKKETSNEPEAARTGDWAEVPTSLLGDDTAKYEVPVRRLADSDVAIALITLDSGESTPKNKHPGHELVLPLLGTVAIRFGGLEVELTGSQSRNNWCFAHYSSNQEHRIVNNSDSPARILVVRFYG